MKIDTVITDEGLRQIEAGETPLQQTLLIFQTVPTDDGRVGVLMSMEGWAETLTQIAYGDPRVRYTIASAVATRMGFDVVGQEP